MAPPNKIAKPAGKPRPAQGAAETIALRMEFYRDNFRKAVTVAVVAVSASVFQTAVIYYLVNRPIQREYFATEQGRIVKLQPLNDPVLTTRQVLSFAQEASVEAYTFDFVHYRKQLSDVTEYFTEEGYAEYIEAVSRSNLDIVKQKRYVVSAVSSGAPVVTRQGLRQGVYSWEVQMPMSVTYQSSSERADQRFVVKMLLKRVPTTVNPRGIGVQQIILDDTVPQA